MPRHQRLLDALNDTPTRSPVPEPPVPLVRLWLLRILLPLGGLRQLVHDGQGASGLLATLGVPHDLREGGTDAAGLVAIRRVLESDWQALEAQADAFALPVALEENLARLAALVQLSAVDCRLLGCACLLQTLRLFEDAADTLGPLTPAKAIGVLATLLDLPEVAVKRALAPAGVLAHSGLLSLRRAGQGTLSTRLELFSASFAEAMLAPDTEPLALLRGAVASSAPARLTLDDYPHLGLSRTLLRTYLASALGHHSAGGSKRGTNVLLYGPPGTGKTELCRTLAAVLDCELLEVSAADEDGDPIGGEQRLRAWRAAQRFLARRRALILFDEIEDVFTSQTEGDVTGLFALHSPNPGKHRKGWLHRALETNPVPTFWVTNAVGEMDAALIRRFDLVLELPVPPRQVRDSIARATVGALVGAETLAALAASAVLAPAVLTRAADVVRQVGAGLDPAQRDAALLALVNHTLRAQGHTAVMACDPQRLPCTYDPRLVHADVDLQAIAQGIAHASHTGGVRLCLYGLPGTGKSAYARWLAEQLGRPLQLWRASDLLAKWLGASERLVARAFHDAQEDGAVLLIDEIDGLLQDRRGAAQAWEVTLVNELLTQMEAFPGVFIATTNRLEGLDPAALRRFDLKLQFRALRPEQAWALLGSHCAVLGLGVPEEGLRQDLRALASLTPGDFATVARRHRLQPLRSAQDFVIALRTECGFKPGGVGAGTMGFV
ncbi:AAA family ATPase [Thiomonas delicata]|uniref:Putative ATPases of the AAA+ class n=1 Tax=Thiomonas delicata TaxID=364030 RepID=A0A238D7Q4_THIDL|nr:ATP-binding protein [Thiomonas delicata]SBP89190.1 putative ATPases of the AAA+ class [Thiomonas delicata]